MSKRKVKEVSKFGGTEKLGEIREVGNLGAFKGDVSSDKVAGVNDVAWDANAVEAQSETKLENDLGVGKEVIMRAFTFKADVKLFKAAPPTKQQLFDGHQHGIEMALFRDGLIFEKSHEPHILFKKNTYTIFVVATPARGQTVVDRTQTLSQIAHG